MVVDQSDRRDCAGLMGEGPEEARVVQHLERPQAGRAKGPEGRRLPHQRHRRLPGLLGSLIGGLLFVAAAVVFCCGGGGVVPVVAVAAAVTASLFDAAVGVL